MGHRVAPAVPAPEVVADERRLRLPEVLDDGISRVCNGGPNLLGLLVRAAYTVPFSLSTSAFYAPGFSGALTPLLFHFTM
jgi:hypothetical protein